MSEEFCAVTRKKWMARKNLQRRPRKISDRYEDYPEVDVDKFIKRLVNLRQQMATSDYFLQAMSTLQESLQELPGTEKLQRIVCLGVGPFTRTYQALHQLAFILCAQHNLSIQEATFFDPVFRESEKEILQQLDCKVMKENCEAKYECDVTTLFYLPHCPNSLTNNLLWSNWRPNRLCNVVLINNSFDSLVSSKPERILKLDSEYILNVMPYAKEFPLEDDYETHNVFNDLSVHVFPLEGMPVQDAAFWTPREAPTYKDVEMISAKDFENLSLT